MPSFFSLTRPVKLQLYLLCLELLSFWYKHFKFSSPSSDLFSNVTFLINPNLMTLFQLQLPTQILVIPLIRSYCFLSTYNLLFLSHMLIIKFIVILLTSPTKNKLHNNRDFCLSLAK